MKRQWYGRDSELSIRMIVVVFLLTAVYLLFIGVLWDAGVPTVWIIFFAGAMLAAQYFFSDKLVLMATRAKEVSPADAPELHARIERLAAMVDLPKPKVAIMEHDMSNAFATGRSPSHSVVAVTNGLMRTLSDDEIDAVLAHELSHIRNRDVMVMTIASFFSTVAYFLVRSLMYVRFDGGDRRKGGNPIIVVWLVSLLVWIVSFLLLRALSRYRELAADRGSAIITGAPSQLASALTKISGVMGRIPKKDLREVQGANAFFILPAVTGESIMELFSTHPSLKTRLDRLERLSQEIERL